MDEKDIERLINKFEKSSLTEMTLEEDGKSLYFSKIKSHRRPTVKVTDKQIESQPETKKLNAPAGDYQLKAPMVGILYFAPSPEKEDFKKIGDHVKKGEPVAIIEAMKMVNEVKSPVSGVIKKRLAENGAMVEYNEPIFDIKED